MNDYEIFDMILDMEFVDRYELDQERAVDVIIPILNTNPLFEKSLINFYKRLPINRLLIGDGGCEDNSIEIVNKFPRTTVFNQHNMRSLGYRIRKLIEACETDFIVYLHADVFLAIDWFDVMYSHRLDADWSESGRKYVSIVTWEGDEISLKRAYSGSQFGNTKKLQQKLSVIDDDFLYRNEDIIISELMNRDDYRKFGDTYHYHQILSKQGTTEPSIIITPKITRSKNVDWEKWVYEWQWKGIVKYCDPKPYLVKAVNAAINVLVKNKAFNKEEAQEWVSNINPQWVPYIGKKWYEFWRR